jgi:hypothetical protein
MHGWLAAHVLLPTDMQTLASHCPPPSLGRRFHGPSLRRWMCPMPGAQWRRSNEGRGSDKRRPRNSTTRPPEATPSSRCEWSSEGTWPDPVCQSMLGNALSCCGLDGNSKTLRQFACENDRAQRFQYDLNPSQWLRHRTQNRMLKVASSQASLIGWGGGSTVPPGALG